MAKYSEKAFYMYLFLCWSLVKRKKGARCKQWPSWSCRFAHGRVIWEQPSEELNSWQDNVMPHVRTWQLKNKYSEHLSELPNTKSAPKII
jgi:hypothetical protein